MTGVVVTNTEGSVGSAVSIQIRGLNSFGSGTAPLYIVDGVIINSSNSSAVFSSYVHGTSALNSINPNDIASIDILKGRRCHGHLRFARYQRCGSDHYKRGPSRQNKGEHRYEYRLQ
ncbi:MAG: TonB-dependent receptor plug domain-containing protein [Marinilabiliales bacterium]|nr:TonB-dependent receptor plug domain-containing protein [Marinilabiliales bacterium]